MRERLGIALELAERRRAFAARLSPLARRLAFPAVHALEVERRCLSKRARELPLAKWTAQKNATSHDAALAALPQTTLITEVCARHWEVPQSAIYDHPRKAIYTRPRQASMALMRELIGLSFPAIGCALRRDHSTVVHGIRTHEERLETDADYRRRFDAASAEVRRLLGNATTSDTVAASGEADGVTEPPSRPSLANHQWEAA